MDDIFQIIIWLFIIISFFSSFFKKKDKSKAPPPQRQQPDYQRQRQAEQRPVPQKMDTEEYDILQEIERMFKTDTSAPTPMEKKENAWKGDAPTASEHTREHVGMDVTRSQSEQVFTSSEHTFRTPSQTFQDRFKTKVKEVDATLSKQAEQFEKYLTKKRATGNAKTSAIRQKLKQPESIREYIIMAEILGKPPGLTRGRRTVRR